MSGFSVWRALLLAAAPLVALTPAALVSARAQAQEPEAGALPQAKIDAARAHAEAGAAHVRGDPGGDAQGFERCAAAFVELYNRYEGDPRADSLLWMAAQCSEADGMVGRSVELLRALISTHPESEHRRDALVYLAQSLEGVASYEEAAQRYEEFAEQYPKDGEAHDGLHSAYLIRLGLGDERAAEADLATLTKVYGRRDVERAAGLFWTHLDTLERDEERREYALDYLRAYEHEGGADRRIVAEAVVAQIDWRRSCPEPLLLDSCISIERERPPHPSALALEAALAKLEGEAGTKTKAAQEPEKPARRPVRCGGDSPVTVTVHRRGAKLAQSAQERLRKILALAGDKGDIRIPAEDRARAGAFRDAWGMAVVYEADQRLEAYLAMEFPGDLDFTYPEKSGRGSAGRRAYGSQLRRYEASRKRFHKFAETKMRLARELTDDYSAVKDTGSLDWMLTGALRTAWVSQSWGDQLAYAQVPRGLRAQAETGAYCKVLTDLSEVVLQQAREGYAYCVRRATDFQFFTPAVRYCEAELALHDPLRYAPTVELFGAPGYAPGAPVRMTVVELVAEESPGRRAD